MLESWTFVILTLLIRRATSQLIVITEPREGASTSWKTFKREDGSSNYFIDVSVNLDVSGNGPEESIVRSSWHNQPAWKICAHAGIKSSGLEKYPEEQLATCVDANDGSEFPAVPISLKQNESPSAELKEECSVSKRRAKSGLKLLVSPQ